MLLITCAIIAILSLAVFEHWLHYKKELTHSIPEKLKYRKYWHAVSAFTHVLLFALIAYLVYGITLYAGAVVMFFVAIRHLVFDAWWNIFEGHKLLYRGANVIESLLGDWVYMGFKVVHFAFTLFLILFPARWNYEVPLAFYILAGGCVVAYTFYHKK